MVEELLSFQAGLCLMRRLTMKRGILEIRTNHINTNEMQLFFSFI